MPKMKTRRAAAKRFEIKPSGKVKRAHANKEHILTKKSRSRKNRLKKAGYVDSANMSNLKLCLPNG
jgi:large subunit ribosomal protein L35